MTRRLGPEVQFFLSRLGPFALGLTAYVYLVAVFTDGSNLQEMGVAWWMPAAVYVGSALIVSLVLAVGRALHGSRSRAMLLVSIALVPCLLLLSWAIYPVWHWQGRLVTSVIGGFVMGPAYTWATWPWSFRR